MEDNNLNTKDYAKIRELLASSNQKFLQSLLGFSSRKSNAGGGGNSEPEIYSSTPKASTLLKCLQNKLSGKKNERYADSNEDCNLTVDDILRALLMIDPMYITPWNALDEFASALPIDSVCIISVLQCVSSIEEFLVKAKFSFAPSKSDSDKKMVPQSIRELMVQFVEKLTNYLLLTLNFAVETDSSQLNLARDKTRAPVVIELATELVHTTFSVCKGWCPDVFKDIISVVHLRPPSPQRIKIWLQLVQRSILFLTSKQIEDIGTMLLDLLCDYNIVISPAQDVALIIKIVVEIAHTLDSTPSTADSGSAKTVTQLWRSIAFEGLYETVVRYDQQCYLESENSLKEGIKKWNISSLKNWISEIIDASAQSTSTSDNDDSIPDWFAVNLILLCTEVLRDIHIPSNQDFLDKKVRLDRLNQKGNLNCLSGHEYQKILHFIVGSAQISGDQFQSLWDFVSEVEKPSLHYEQDIDKIFYRNGGLFYLENVGAEKFDCLSGYGSLIVNSLCLKDCQEPDGGIHDTIKSLLPRTIRLVNMVDHIQTSCPDDCLVLASIFAVVVKTVAYFEVPEYQSTLEYRIERDLSRASRLQNSHFSTLCLIAYSALKRDGNIEMTDRWCGIIERSIPFSHVNYLDRILLTILPVARSSVLNISSSVLNMSKKLLEPLYSSWGAREYENETIEVMPERKIQQRIIGGLRGLLGLIRSDRWGGNEILAWGILSDSMVKDLPPLPSTCRQWLFRTFASRVSDGIFDSKTADRILRATAARMSSFFVDYEAESKIPATTKQMEEIRSLHRLMAKLFQFLATADECRHMILAQGRETFLRAIHLYQKGQLVGNQFHHGISKQYHSLQGKNTDGFVLCWLIFLKINLYLLDDKWSGDSKIRTFGHLENSSMNHETSLLNLVCKIKDLESQDLQVDHDADPDKPSCIPWWPHSQTIGDLDPVKFTNTELTGEFPSLDLLLEFLFMVPLPVGESLDLDDVLSWKVITASGFLMSRKETSSQKLESVISIETVENTAEPFLSTSSFLFRGAIDTNCNLSALDDLLTPIVSYCRALHLTVEANEVPGCSSIIGGLWNLYQAVASEKACVKLIEYLESRVSERHAVSNQRDYNFLSLGSASTDSDIDDTVRQLRFSCLQPFLSCMSFLSNIEATDDTSLTRSIVGGMLDAIVADLRTGLDGKSGGIPRTLYITYCMSIEECGSLLFHRRGVHFDYPIFILFRDVITTLSDILVTVPLRDAVLFRTTFILAVAVFPSMCRDLVRRSLHEYCDEFSDTDLRADSRLFEEVLDDCIDILIRWAALREPCSVPWLDIAGPDHSYEEFCEPRSYIDLHEEYWGTPEFDKVPGSLGNRLESYSRRRKFERKIRLYSKELWSWALSCSLLGLEQKWLESERTIQEEKSKRSSVRRKKSFGSRTSGWNHFFGPRSLELHKSLLQINRFFRAPEGLQQRDPKGNHIVLDMMAINLPSAPRLRFCCLIECVSRVLVHSIQHFCLFLRKETKDQDQEISVFESVCCLGAWLNVADEPENDFSVGVFKWLAIASRKSPPGEVFSTKRKEDKAELFERVSVISRVVHNLYLELKELQKLLRNRGVDKSVEGPLLKCYFHRGDSIASEMLRCTGLKLHSLEQVIPSEFKTKSLPDFPSSSVGMESLGQKRVPSETRRQASTGSAGTSRSKKRRVQSSIIKNRNRVVDIFMNLDKGSDSPRRNNTRDAYADLEDFLVEG